MTAGGESLWPTPERYLIDSAGVFIPARVAAAIFSRSNLGDYHRNNRGSDPEFDAVVVALKTSSARWRAFVGASEPRKAAQVGARSEWLSATEAADQLGLTSAAVRLACRQGRINAELADGRWRISREEFEHQRASRAAA